MLDFNEEYLTSLLTNPSESMTEEYKDWLDLSQNSHKAKLAKEAIALANEGGGIIILGMKEDDDDGGRLISQTCPSNISRYSLDDINSAISRYAEPEFHCDLVFEVHPESQIEHAFVIVPGGMTVPVMSKRGCDGEIVARRCYVRKAGPKSEEPYTSEEWRRLLDRCLRERREDMLDAIRNIVIGRVEPVIVTDDVASDLQNFISDSRDRWLELVETLDMDSPIRMPLGYYEIAFSLVGFDGPVNLTQLRESMQEASRIRLTGWPVFIQMPQSELMPRPFQGTIEAWIGNPEAENRSVYPDTSDYWRAHPRGNFYLRRGYSEDATHREESGKAINLRIPIWRVGETLLYAARLSRLFGENIEILVQSKYSGLDGRHFTSGGDFSLGHQYVCYSDDVELKAQFKVEQIEDNLDETLHTFLLPLYESFSFFPLRLTDVANAVDSLRNNRF